MGCEITRVDSQRVDSNKTARSVLIRQPARAFGQRIDGQLKAHSSIVCTIHSTKFLMVSPEVQWITDYTSATFEVRSNVDWIVE